MSGRASRIRIVTSVLLLTACAWAACDARPEEDTGRGASPSADADTTRNQRLLNERADSLADALAARTDSLFRRIEPFSSGEAARLRRYIQDDHLAIARRIGIEPLRDRRAVGAFLSRPEEERSLVRIRTSDFYIVDPRMSYAVAATVPSVQHLLQHIGERFARDMAAHGLPPYRFILTNLLRTGLDQAHLRGTNINATRGESTHEYGTTFDVYYDRFHYAAGLDSAARKAAGRAGLDDALLRDRLRPTYRAFGQTHAPKIKAVLGRTLIDLQNEGALVTTYERRQAVFHITVARALPEQDGESESRDERAPLRRQYANMESQLVDVDNDVEELRAKVAGADADAGQAFAALEGERLALWRELDRIDRLSPAEFRDAEPRIRRRMAELEGQVERTNLLVMDAADRVRSRLAGILRTTDRTLSQLEAQVESGSSEMRARYGGAVSDLRRRCDEIEALREEIGGLTGADFERARSRAADAAAGLIADLHVVAGEIDAA